MFVTSVQFVGEVEDGDLFFETLDLFLEIVDLDFDFFETYLGSLDSSSVLEEGFLF